MTLDARAREECFVRLSALEQFDIRPAFAAGSVDEVREIYDEGAHDFEGWSDRTGYAIPDRVFATARRFLATEAVILDAGAGTGLLGVLLHNAGFTNLDGIDTST